MIVRLFISWSQRNGLFYAYAGLVLFFALSSDRFLTAANIEVILLQIAVFGIIAVPGASLILSGYVDLSIGSIAVLVSILFGQFVTVNHISTLWASVLTLLIAVGWGLAQGYVIAYLGFSPIVVTLGSLAGARGLGEYISKGQNQYDFGASFARLGNGQWLGIDVPVWICAAAFLIGAYAWYQMPYGRRMTAIGSDRTVARSLGVAVKRIPFVLYGLSALAAGLGGLTVTSQLDGSSLSIGVGWELQVLTGILLGGVAFVGGRGSLFGVLIGVLFIGTLTNGLIVINISPFIQNVAVGAALFFAAALDVLYQRLDRIPVSDVSDETERGGLFGLKLKSLRRTQ